ncbi:MAG TPA: putative metal-binding motif-containing protein [Candidatus Polarisedimenticolaceae bacterium]
MNVARFVFGAAAALLATAVAGAPPGSRDIQNPTNAAGGSSYYRDADRDGTLNVFDCNDDDGRVHPGATETFDGVDEDCNGAIDDGFDTTIDFAMRQIDRALPGWIALDSAPRVAWTGAAFVVVWADRDDLLRLVRISPEGTLLDPEPLVLRAGVRSPDVAWSGTRLGIVYEDRSTDVTDVRLMTLDVHASLLLDTLVYAGGAEPRIAWGQQQFGVVWRRASCFGDCVGYRTFDREGRPVDPIEMLPNSAGCADIAWSGSGTIPSTIEWNVVPGRFGIVYEAYFGFAATGDVLLVTRDPSAHLPGGLARVNTHDNVPAPGGAMPSISGNPSGFAVSWHVFENDVNGAHLRFFGVLDLEGILEFPPDADAAFFSDVVWSGSEFIVVNENTGVGPLGGTDVHFRRIDSSGNAHPPGNWGPWSELNLSAGTGGAISTRPSIANAGPGLGVVWVEQEGTESYGHVRFATVVHR